MPETRGPGAARNVGWRAAQAQVIAFTDDDTVPGRDWLREGLGAFSPGAMGVWGRVIVLLSAAPSDYQREIARLANAEGATANCFYRRETLIAVSGFDERFTAAWREDSDLYSSAQALWRGRARAGCGRDTPGARCRLGNKPRAAAQGPVQRVVVQEIPGPVSKQDSGAAAVSLLRNRRDHDRHHGRSTLWVAQCGRSFRLSLAPAHRRVPPAPALGHLAPARARDGDGADVRIDSARVAVLVRMRRLAFPNAVFLNPGYDETETHYLRVRQRRPRDALPRRLRARGRIVLCVGDFCSDSEDMSGRPRVRRLRRELTPVARADRPGLRRGAAARVRDRPAESGSARAMAYLTRCWAMGSKDRGGGAADRLGGYCTMMGRGAR